MEREEYINLVRDITGYKKEVLLAQADITVVEPLTAPETQEPPRETTKLSAAKLFVLASLAQGKPYVDYNEDLAFLIDNECERAVYEFAVARVRGGDYRSPGGLFSEVPEKYAGELAEILEYEFLDGDDGGKSRRMRGCLKTRRHDAEKERLAAEYGAETDKDKKKDLLHPHCRIGRGAGKTESTREVNGVCRK